MPPHLFPDHLFPDNRGRGSLCASVRVDPPWQGGCTVRVDRHLRENGCRRAASSVLTDGGTVPVRAESLCLHAELVAVRISHHSPRDVLQPHPPPSSPRTPNPVRGLRCSPDRLIYRNPVSIRSGQLQTAPKNLSSALGRPTNCQRSRPRAAREYPFRNRTTAPHCRRSAFTKCLVSPTSNGRGECSPTTVIRDRLYV
jgi:hypothetical protein